jgi:predicted kinase
MPTAIIGIGLPGSGKTTKLKALSNRKNMVYISADEVRYELTGDESDQTMNKEVWELIYIRIDNALLDNCDVIIDATNCRYEDRINLLEYCSIHATMIIGNYFEANVETCKKRNSSRQRVVPDYAIDRMAKWLKDNPPVKEEGYDLFAKYDTN